MKSAKAVKSSSVTSCDVCGCSSFISSGVSGSAGSCGTGSRGAYSAVMPSALSGCFAAAGFGCARWCGATVSASPHAAQQGFRPAHPHGLRCSVRRAPLGAFAPLFYHYLCYCFASLLLCTAVLFCRPHRRIVRAFLRLFPLPCVVYPGA